ncbi:MAG: histidine phosphatase family protein [Candidatus Woesearchaeota archaeon]|nr:MAG: histidine phosphatase family protein [Candidatus Woesearchaeota archaeon]
MITLYLIRHGRTECNTLGKAQGHIDSPLTDEGYKNAFFMADKLKKYKFDHIYSSDLGRAFITAHIIAEELKLETKIVRVKELREINYGDYGGMYRKKIREICPQFKKDADYVFPKGESYNQQRDRVLKFIFGLKKRHKDKTALIVAHGGVVRVPLLMFKNLDYEKNLEFVPSNQYIGKFVIDKGKIIEYEEIHP